MQVQVQVQVCDAGSRYDAGSILWYVLPKQKENKKKEGYQVSMSTYVMVEMKPLVESRIFFFLVFVRSKALFSGSW